MEFKEEEVKKPGRHLSTPKVLALCLVFLVIGILVGSTSQIMLGPTATNILARLGFPVDVNLAKLMAVQDLVLEQHVNSSLDPNVMMESAIRGLLSKVDGGLTRYESPTEAQASAEQSSGEYAGIGVTVRLVDEQVHVESVFRGSPALESGVLPKDIIVAVEGKSIRGLILSDVTKQIKGPVGTPVNITIFRPSTSSTLDLTITRGLIVIPVVTTEVLSPNLAHIVLTQFTTTAMEQMRQALTSLEDAGVGHLLLDLRYNPGGYTAVVEAIADYFLEPGLVVYKTVDRNGNATEHKTREGVLYTGGVTLLVNEGSASASEILTGALRDHRQVKVLGKTTYGKGTVQQAWPLGDGSRVWITVQSYRIPSGIDIGKVGLTPDVVIENSDQTTTVDTQLEEAIKYVRENILK